MEVSNSEQFKHRLSHQYNNCKNAQHCAEGQMQTIDCSDDERKNTVFSTQDEKTRDQVQNHRSQNPATEDQVHPLEHCKELRRRRSLPLILPHFWVGEDYKEGVVTQKKENS